MSREQINQLVSDYLEAELWEVQTRLATDAWRVNDHGEHGDWHDVAQTALADQAEELEQALARNNLRVTLEDAKALLPDADGDQQQILARRLLEARHTVTVAELRALQGQPLPSPPSTVVAPKVPARVAGPLLSKVCTDYVATTRTAKRWTPKTLASNEMDADLLVALVGDKPITAVSKDDMRTAYLNLARVPSNANKRYPRLSPLEAIAAADAAKDADRLQERTRNTRLQVWKSVLLWAVNNHIIEKNPADPLKAFATGKGQDARAAFTDGQLKVYFGLLQSNRSTYFGHCYCAPVGEPRLGRLTVLFV